MEEVHEGGCACGAVRYRVKNAPFRTSVYHCRNCQRRTGSAFGVGIYFKQQDFELLRGELKPYRFRSDESGRWLSMEFCTSCGTTVTWTAAEDRPARLDALRAPLDGVPAGH
jgi:hypothetical protein